MHPSGFYTLVEWFYAHLAIKQTLHSKCNDCISILVIFFFSPLFCSFYSFSIFSFYGCQGLKWRWIYYLNESRFFFYSAVRNVCRCKRFFFHFARSFSLYLTLGVCFLFFSYFCSQVSWIHFFLFIFASRSMLISGVL